MAIRETKFDSLSDFHDAVNEWLLLPETKLRIIRHDRQKWAHHVSEASLKIADSCAAAKDLLLLARGHLQDLQSAFRHIAAAAGKDEDRSHTNFASHRLPRKQLKKAILKRLQSLKGMKTATSAYAGEDVEEEEEEKGKDRSLVKLLKEVRATTVAIVDSLMSLIAMPNPDSRKSGSGRDPVFRIKLSRADSLSFWEKCQVSEIRTVMKRLEEVEMAVEDMESELEGMFRRLIRTRAALLNILTF